MKSMDLAKPPDDPDHKNIIDKLANFVARNGPEFEQMTKQKQKDNPRFAFLFGGEHYNYYQYRVTTEQAILKQHQQKAAQQQQQQQQQMAQAAQQQVLAQSMAAATPPPPVQQPWQAASQPNAVNNVQTQQLREQLEQQKQASQEQVIQSEQNLADHYKNLIQQQQAQIDEAIAKQREDNFIALSVECDITVEELDRMSVPIIESCTKDAISNGKNWLFAHNISPRHSDLLAEYLYRRIIGSDAPFETRLHLIYLMNDVLHHCMRKNAEDLRRSLENIVIPVFCITYQAATEEKKQKLLKLLDLWEKNKYFEEKILVELKEPTQAMHNYQSNLLVKHQDIVQKVSAEVNQHYTSLQKQHQEFVNHLNSQIAQLEQQLQQAEAAAATVIPPPAPAPPPLVQQPPPVVQPQPPPPAPLVTQPATAAPLGQPQPPPLVQQPTTAAPMGQQPPPPPAAPPLVQQPPPPAPPLVHQPPPASGPPMGYQPPSQHEPIQAQPPPMPPASNAPPNYHAPQPGFGAPALGFPPAPPMPPGSVPQNSNIPQQFDYAHGQNTPFVQDYNHGQGPPAPAAPGQGNFALPDFSKPPPGFPSLGGPGPPPPPYIPHGPPPPGPPASEADLMPSVPYYDLPAGLMAPLVKLEDCDYKPLNSKDIRLPPPQPPSDRLLAAVEAFYSPPSHERPRDGDGWEKLGLYEFFRAKQRAKKMKEERRSRSGSSSSSRSSSSRSSSSSSYSRSRSRSRSRSPRRRRKRSRSRSRSSYRRRSDSRSRSRSRSASRSRSRTPPRRARRSRERSATPPSFGGDAVYQQTLDSRLGTENKGHQLLAKMGWGGGGLGAKEQGRVDPVEAAEARDKLDQFKGLGMNMADPFEQFRKNKAQGFITRMRSRDPAS